jgi:uncharacterized protein
MPERLYALIYEYVEDMATRREPHRAGHLELISRWHDEGRLEIAGALGDPPHGGFFGFRVDAPGDVEAFVGEDPYVAAGLVTEHRIEPWTVVT